jgi:Protein of unknown function (DUF2695)
MTMTLIMGPEHPRWEEFAERLRSTTRTLRDCNHTTRNAEAVLAAIGGLDIEASLAGFREHGGYCDCEIIMNAIHGDWLQLKQN